MATRRRVIDPIDGRILAPLLRGERDDWDNDIMVEFTAEGTFAPALILRQGAYKYVYCETDPGKMYDLENDPHELNNFCANPAYSDRAKAMEAVLLKRWDPFTLKADIIASQQRRHFLQKTMQAGAAPMQDFQPFQDTSKLYLRSGNSPTHVKGLARFPFVCRSRRIIRARNKHEYAGRSRYSAAGLLPLALAGRVRR